MEETLHLKVHKQLTPSEVVHMLLPVQMHIAWMIFATVSYTHLVQGAQADLATQNPLSLLYDRNNHGTTKRSLGNIQLD